MGFDHYLARFLGHDIKVVTTPGAFLGELIEIEAGAMVCRAKYLGDGDLLHFNVGNIVSVEHSNYCRKCKQASGPCLARGIDG